MDLGNAKFQWFPYVPEYNGNRDLPEEEQLRLEIRRMRSIDRVDQITWSEAGAIESWLEEYLKNNPVEQDVLTILKRVHPGLMIRMRQFIENTRGYAGFVIDGEPQTNPLEIFFHLCANLDEENNLLAEINNAIVKALTLEGEDLKNFKEQCAGLKPLESTAPVAA